MSPNPSTRWGRVLADELVAAGVTSACLTPGSRSTPLTLGFVERDDVAVSSHLDERSAAFFALGRAKRSGRPTALVCTSGTAAANYHPAVMEADRSRTSLVVCTADRPPELHDSGANQTADQDGLYGSAVRWSRTLPEPGAGPRKLRALRVAACRAVAAATRPPAGPVHLNVPFAKPLSPTEPADPPAADPADGPGEAAASRPAPFVEATASRRTLPAAEVDRLAEAVAAAERGLVVAGPADPGFDGASAGASAVASFAAAAGFPLLADPLSGLRFGPHVDATPVVGGYDAYLRPPVSDGWPSPDLVVRVGASPTSKALRDYLAGTDARQLLVDQAGGWREATFTATDLVEADPGWLAGELAARLEDGAGHGPASSPWLDRFEAAEDRHWAAVDAASADFEGGYVAAALEALPMPATLFASNSMPVRDLDAFGRPSTAAITAVGNRGVSGVDGITSTALGAGSATDDHLVLLTGDLAYYHDMNGLLAVSRCDVDATIVVIDNDGGGIFHRLPIADHDAFTDWFETPHGLDFEPTGALYDLDVRAAGSTAAFREAFTDAVGSEGTTVIVVESDAAASHRVRDRVFERVRDALADG